MTVSNRQNPCCVYDFTLKKTENFNDKSLKEELLIFCKSGTFQLEKGLSGYLHFQGRISLKIKKRLNQLIKYCQDNELLGGIARWSITSNENKNNHDYVSKGFTRIGKTIDITYKQPNIPRQIKEITKLRPFQSSIIDRLVQWDTRTINYVYCVKGNNGKSILITYCSVYGLARKIPVCNDIKDIMRMVMNLPTSKAYMIDMPKAINKERLFQFWSGIEEIKNGYAWDDRYKFKEKYFDCPNIWVFGNHLPDEELMSKDRWKFWKITKNYELKRYEETNTEDENIIFNKISPKDTSKEIYKMNDIQIYKIEKIMINYLYGGLDRFSKSFDWDLFKGIFSKEKIKVKAILDTGSFIKPKNNPTFDFD